MTTRPDDAMPTMKSSRRIRTVARTNRLRAAATLLAVLAVAACKNAPFFEYQRIENARRIAAELRIELSKSAEASNRAVMAITDEESAAFAGEAAASTRKVTKGVDALDRLHLLSRHFGRDYARAGRQSHFQERLRVVPQRELHLGQRAQHGNSRIEVRAGTVFDEIPRLVL